MSTATQDNRQRVTKLVQELLLDEPDQGQITADLIQEKIDEVLSLRPRWGEDLDRQGVTDELIRRFSVWVGDDATLSSGAGHEAWLTAARKRDWRYWQRYQEWSEARLPGKAVEALDRATDAVLGQLEDPLREGAWDRRGLVVGHVQSGKTGNYTGLICKAADAGYKIIIVLAGVHNNLRSQTQMRLDEGFLGYETRPIADDLRIIGVGEIDRDGSIRPNSGTDRTEGGDFNARASRLAVSPEQRPWLFVVKKNKTVLERLNKWIKTRVADAKDPETGRPIVTNLPLLVIDDEADNASVDTGEVLFDESGVPDLEHQPTAINKLIRRILHSFTHSAYVGYTATPFANIFIHERGKTRDEGTDLFPESFIVSLAAPSNYVGPTRVFGLRRGEGVEGLPLVQSVKDCASEDGGSGWMPVVHKNGHVPLYENQDILPPSLRQAVDSFVLACAARNLRGQAGQHSSMLVHVTRFTAVQSAVSSQIKAYVSDLRQRLTRRIGHEEALGRLEALWKTDFEPTTARVALVDADTAALDALSWDEIAGQLKEVISDIDVRTINGSAKDALDYADQSGAGLKVIAIGGDKLARGLTLEGLTTSYFLRASKMYDTLMQMGRWFGYRPGYIDLCRLYTTSDLISWFRHIADAAEELREEFDVMAAIGSTPRDYGLKVQSHPVLMVTSRLKMRTAKELLLSFSGHVLETVALHTDKAKLASNLRQTRALLERLGPAAESEKIERARGGGKQTWQGALWTQCPADAVVDFFRNYVTHPDAMKVNSALIAEFIESMNTAGELTEWTVAVIGGGEGKKVELTSDLTVDTLLRRNQDDTGYKIGRLLSPRDEAIDLSEAAWAAALDMTRKAWRSDPGRMEKAEEPAAPNGPSIREIRGAGAEGVPAHPERGLLLIYAVTPDKDASGVNGEPVIAFGVSFPGSRAGRKVSYKVNNVAWELDYGSSE
jgi:hypothetical protein